MSEAASLVPVARLLGDLLLVELDAERGARLQTPEAAEALAAVGIEVPAEGDFDADALASAYHAAFLRPTGGGAPPVASLWTEGRFEGAIAARIRELARSAAVDFDREEARGAPVDHLGVLLHLWAGSVERAPWVAEEIARDHLAWADAPLTRVEEAGGFYGGVARATRAFCGVLRGTVRAESV